MTNQTPNSKKFDLEDRTKSYAREVILFCRLNNKDNTIKPLINQLIRSGTSIGANYMEANECSSKKDFKHKISICKKEAKETMYWVELISDSTDKDSARKLWREAHEFVLIFASILSK